MEVAVWSASWLDSAAWLAESGLPRDAATRALAEGVLGAFQDDVIEFVVRTGWPPSDPAEPDAPQRGDELPAPFAQVVDGVLVWGYGDPDEPALDFPPIHLDAVTVP